MEQNKSTISLTAPPDSDWGKAERFVIDRGFSPVFVSWDSYIACLILHWEGDLENEGQTVDNYPIENWLALLRESNRLEDFDYE